MTGFMWFVVLAVAITAILYVYINTRMFINEFMFKREMARRQERIKGKREFDASMRNGTYHV